MIYFEYFLVIFASFLTPIFILNCFALASDKKVDETKLHINAIFTGLTWGIYFLIHNA